MLLSSTTKVTKWVLYSVIAVNNYDKLAGCGMLRTRLPASHPLAGLAPLGPIKRTITPPPKKKKNAQKVPQKVPQKDPSLRPRPYGKVRIF